MVPTGESTCCRIRSNDGAAVGHGPGDGTRWDFGSHYANDGVASSTLVKARGQTKIQSNGINRNENDGIDLKLSGFIDGDSFVSKLCNGPRND